MIDFDPYWSVPRAVVCLRKNSYDAEITFNKINYIIASGFKTRVEALNAANTIIEPLLTKFYRECNTTIQQFKKAKA